MRGIVMRGLADVNVDGLRRTPTTLAHRVTTNHQKSSLAIRRSVYEYHDPPPVAMVEPAITTASSLSPGELPVVPSARMPGAAGHPISAPRPMRSACYAPPPMPEDLRTSDVFVNLDGDYTYLTDGYYRSLEAEHEGLLAIPSPQEALDAYVVPLALAKAAAHQLPVPEWEIINDLSISGRPPFIIYPINPYQDDGQVVMDPQQLKDAINSLGMRGKYAMVCQQLPPDSRVDTLRLVLGKSLKPEYRDLAARLWEVFRLPLARVRVIVTESSHLFSAISPLEKEELTQNEKSILKEAGVWRA